MNVRWILVIVDRNHGYPERCEDNSDLPKLVTAVRKDNTAIAAINKSVGLEDKTEFEIEKNSALFKTMHKTLASAKAARTKMSKKFPYVNYRIGTVVWDDCDEFNEGY